MHSYNRAKQNKNANKQTHFSKEPKRKRKKKNLTDYTQSALHGKYLTKCKKKKKAGNLTVHILHHVPNTASQRASYVNAILSLERMSKELKLFIGIRCTIDKKAGNLTCEILQFMPGTSLSTPSHHVIDKIS